MFMFSSGFNRTIFFFFLFQFLLLSAYAQNDAIMIVSGRTTISSANSTLGGSLGVRSVKTSDEPMEGVTVEVKKNGVTVTSMVTSKKGKYSFQIPVSTTDPKNDYEVYFTKDGMVPRMIIINAYLSKNEFASHSFTKYNLDDQDINMLKTTVKDIVVEKAFAKISWDFVKQHKFDLDQAYAKAVRADEQKLAANPDAYFKNKAKKKKKEEENLAKNKAAADAKLKAEEEAKKLAEEEAKKLAALKAKEEADRIVKANLEAMKNELKKKRIADSLAEVERRKALEVSSANLEIKKIVRPVDDGEDTDKQEFDAAEAYSINISRKSLNTEKEKRNKERSKNISAKYETINVLTSLLNEVDESDKKTKKD